MIEERKQLLLDLKVLQIKKDSLVLSSHLLTYYNRLPKDIKFEIEKYIGNHIREKIFRYLNNYTEIKRCAICNNIVDLAKFNGTWKKYCSMACVQEASKLSGKFTTTGYKHSEKTKHKMSKNHADFCGDKNPFRKAIKDPIIKQKFIDSQLKKWQNRNQEWRDKFAEKLSNANANAKHYDTNKKHKNGLYFSRKMGKNFWYRSSWELFICEVLDDNILVKEYELEPYCISYINNKNKKRSTRLDFLVTLINNKKILLEVKPEGLLNYHNNPEKIKAYKEHCVEFKMVFKILTKKYINKIAFTDLIKEIYESS
jgi:hypothetical protein